MQALGPISAGTKVIGHIVEGQAYDAQAKYNRRVANRNALESERDAAAQVETAREQARKAIGDQIVAQGASGFQTGTGTMADALTESQVNAMLDAMSIRRQGATRAAAQRSQGQLAYMEGKARATSAYFGAAQAAIDGVKDYASAAGGGG